MAEKFTKWPQNLPNGHKIYQMATKFTKWPQNLPNGRKISKPNGLKINQMVIKYINIFHCKTLQNLPQLGFLVLKHTIWQPWPRNLFFQKGARKIVSFSASIKKIPDH
jgi:hypothetical protein